MTARPFARKAAGRAPVQEPAPPLYIPRAPFPSSSSPFSAPLSRALPFPRSPHLFPTPFLSLAVLRTIPTSPLFLIPVPRTSFPTQPRRSSSCPSRRLFHLEAASPFFPSPLKTAASPSPAPHGHRRPARISLGARLYLVFCLVLGAPGGQIFPFQKNQKKLKKVLLFACLL